MAKIIGTAPYQVPTNADLGSMAYQDATGISVDLLQVDNIRVDGNSITSTNTNGNITIDPNGTGIITLDSAVTISGNLTVNGTTTTTNSTTITVDDPVFTLGGDTAPAADDDKDRGIEYRWHNGTAAKIGFFGWDDSAGAFTFIPDATNSSEVFSGNLGAVAFGSGTFNTNTSSTSTTSGTVIVTGGVGISENLWVGGYINVDNLRLQDNTLSSTNANGNIVLAPNGTGDVQLDADTVRVGDANAAATITTNGTGNLTLSTNAGTNSGTILINNGANGNIELTPDGTGDVYLNADTVRVGDANAAATITTNGTGNLTLSTNAGTNSGAILINQGANGNIELTPDGTGDVYLNADTVRVGDANTAATVTTNGTGNLTIRTGSTNSGTILINQGDNGNIVVTPHGTGDVQLDADTIRIGDADAAVTLTTNGAAPLTINTGAVGATAAGNTIAITGGLGGATSGAGGAVTVQAGSAQTLGAAGALNLYGGAAVGSNQAGADVTIRAGNGTGTAGSGSIILQTAAVGTSGTTANTLTTRVTVAPSGSVTAAANITSTSTTSGTVIVTGGVGISENLWVGGYINIDNLRLQDNTLSSTNTDGNIVLAPNGTGDVQLDADTVRIGDSGAAATLTTNGAGNLTIRTGSTNSGSILINQGDNGNIDIEPHGTGDVNLNADTVRVGDSGAAATITTNGTGNLTVRTGSTNSGTILINQGDNGNIVVAPHGTGDVQLDADTVRIGDAGAAATLTTNGAGNLTLSTNEGTNSGTILINNGANGNIEVTPNGTGDVYLNADTVRVGDSNAAATITTNGTGNLTVRTGSTNSGTILINQGDNANIEVNPHGTGNVLIGTSTTRNRLTVSSSAGADAPTLGTASGTALFANNDVAYGLMTGVAGSGNAWIQVQRVDSTATAYDLWLQPSGGNVSIGTNSADTKLTVLVADAATSTRFKAATGLLRFRPYVNATNGAILDSVNAAENAYLPLTLQGSSLRLFGGGGSGATIDSSGNLALNVTPSAWQTNWRAVQVGASASLWSASAGLAGTYVGNNNYFDGANRLYINSGTAAEYAQLTTGAHIWYSAISGIAGPQAATALTATQNGLSYTITTAGTTNFTLIGAANNNVGTVFIKSGGTGAGTGTATQNIQFSQIMTLSGTSTPALRVGVTADLSGFNFQAKNQVGFSVHNSDSTSTAAYFSGAGNVTLTASGNFAVIHGTDGILFGSGSSERARITSTGNLGVGTNSPDARLAVVAATPSTDNALSIRSNTRLVSPDGTKIMSMRMLDADVLTISGGAGQLFSVSDSLTGSIFAVNDISGMPSIEVFDTGRVQIAELTGNVLIGSSIDNTSNKLQVTGSTSISGSLAVGTSAAATRLDLGSTQASGITLRFDSTAAYRALITPYWNSSTDTRLDFAINNTSGAAPSVYLSVGYNGGNVGIGTVTPAYKLDVAGEFRQTGSNMWFDGASTNFRSDQFFGFLTDTGSAQSGLFKSIQVSTSYSGTLVDNGILFSTDSTLQRTAATTLRTNSTLIVDGNLGVNDTSPSTRGRFSVRNTDVRFFAVGTAGTGTFRFDDNSLPVLVLQNSGITGANQGYGIEWRYGSDGSEAGGAGRIAVGTEAAWTTATASTKDTYIDFSTALDGALNTKVRINSAGSLLVGTTSSTSGRFVVRGIETTNQNTASFGNGTDAQSLDIMCGRALTDGSVGGVASSLVMTFRSSGSSAGVMAFATGNTEHVRLTGTGNLGVGTTTPQYKLDVNNGVTGSSSFQASFGSSYGTGVWSGIHFGYAEAANTNYRKSAIVFERQDGSARGKVHIFNNGSAGTDSATLADARLTIQFDGNVGIGTTSPAYKLEVNGSFAATTKSFVIDHPTKPGKKLRYGSLEGPENGVYVRGRLKDNNVIELPEYWTKLVDPDSITVQLTPIGEHQKLYVSDIKDNKVYVGNESIFAGDINCFYYILAERVDVDKLEVEVD